MKNSSPEAAKVQESGSAGRRPGRRLLRFLITVLLPLAVLVTGGMVTVHLVETGPKASPGAPAGRNARLVEVKEAHRTTESTTVHAMGTVKPALQIDLQPRVNGEVMEVSPELMPGGIFAAGDTVLDIDPTDYKLIVLQRESDVANAESRYQLELGSQSIAESEYELLGETIRPEDRDLVLRKPQLQSVQAALDTAKVALEKARLDLDRTRVHAPFNAIVVTRAVNLGAQVTTATRLATLVGTDTYWVELSVPVAELKWIRIPRAAGEAGSPVRVFNEAAWGPGVFRNGRVIRMAGDLEVEGRMARVIVAVEDPLSLKEDNRALPVLLIGSYVDVEIEGIELENVASVERRLIRDGDRVWIMDGKDELDIRPVTVAFKGPDRVLVSKGIEEGDRIVKTDLGAPVPGMPLRTNPEELPPAEASGEAPGGAAPETGEHQP